tara:strand:- start:845 stop:1117 length:273 start_codon:yes stop_codon:yes gene_type:complete
VAVLPREASYAEFREYVVGLRGALSCAELDELWERRQRLLGIGFVTGRGYRSQLPPDEQHLTREERGQKAESEARSQGRNIERLPDKAMF